MAQLASKDEQIQVLETERARLIGASPALAKAFGVKYKGDRQSDLTEARADALVICVFQNEVPRGMGINMDRVVCFMSRLGRKRTRVNWFAMLGVLAEFKLADRDNLVCIVYAPQFDSTAQTVSGNVLEGYDVKVQISTKAEVLVSSVKLTVSLLPWNAETPIVLQDFGVETIPIPPTHRIMTTTHNKVNYKHCIRRLACKVRCSNYCLYMVVGFSCSTNLLFFGL
jgi:hypothetical protein